MNNHDINNKASRILLRTSRFLATFFILLWVISGVISALSESESWGYESFLLTFFIVTLVIGVIVSWKNERIGGIILILLGASFSIFAYISAGHNKFYAAFITGVPFIISGILFLVYNIKTKSKI